MEEINKTKEEIRNLYSEICKFPYNKMPPSGIRHIVKCILDKINELSVLDKTQNYLGVFERLSMLMEQEMSLVMYAYEKTLQRNSPQIRKTEFLGKLQSLIGAINRALFSVIN